MHKRDLTGLKFNIRKGWSLEKAMTTPRRTRGV